MADILIRALILMNLVGHFDEALSQHLQSDFVLLKAPYSFPGNASSCERAEWRKSVHTDTTAIARKHQNQTFQIEKDFHGEFTFKENHLLLNSANYTDQGLYVFICDEEEKPLKLDVLYAVSVHAAETESVTLHCYAGRVSDVTWLHDNQTLLHCKKDGSINAGKGYEGRVSLEENCFKTGNFSVTIAGVRKADAGIYRCFVDDETVKGEPNTHRLHVNEKRSSPGHQPDSNSTEEQTLFPYQTLTVVFAISSLILISFIVIDKLLKRDGGATENDNESLGDPTSPTNKSQLMDNLPTQESNTSGNKLSSTEPFFNLYKDPTHR